MWTEVERPARGGSGLDLIAVAAASLLVLGSALAGWALLADGVNIFLQFPPLLASWVPHVGIGTPAAVMVALLVVSRGPALAERLGWRSLLGCSYLAAVAWTLSLALVDGWVPGVVERLSSHEEYLYNVPAVADISHMLRTFSDHILTPKIDPQQTFAWTTHVGAHPPGVFLLFLWLDRLGLGGGAAAGMFVILVGSSACVAVAVTLRALGAEQVARRALPFGVLLPGAVWVGVSADGLFAAVLAWGVALVAVSTASRGIRSDVVALCGGILLGYTLYLSYGLVLALLLPLAILWFARGWRMMLFAALGGALVVVAFTAAGFWWFTGFEDVRLIYAASIAETRPYEYFVWADIAALLFALGPAVVAGARRVIAAPRLLPTPALLLVAATAAAVLIADLSGMSKGEVERIWLPFAVWLVLPCVLLPRRWAWLAAQAVLALAVNHLLLTVW